MQTHITISIRPANDQDNCICFEFDRSTHQWHCLCCGEHRDEQDIINTFNQYAADGARVIFRNGTFRDVFNYDHPTAANSIYNLGEILRRDYELITAPEKEAL